MDNDQENHLLILALVVDEAALKLEEGESSEESNDILKFPTRR